MSRTLRASNLCHSVGHDWPIIGATEDGRKVRGGRCRRCGRPHRRRNPEAFMAMKRFAGLAPRARSLLAAKIARRQEAMKRLRRPVIIDRDSLFGRPPTRWARFKHWLTELVAGVRYRLWPGEGEVSP